MNSLLKKYNIYCDESRVENLDSKKMVIGALILSREKKDKISKELKEIFKKNNFLKELKWSKLNKIKKNFYLEIIDYFLKKKGLNFRSIIIDKSKIDYLQYHNNDQELAFFKFYYLLLKPIFINNNEYYIFLDKKPTRDKKRAVSLFLFLKKYLLSNKINCYIKHLQAYSSKENIFIQITDFFTGLLAFACNLKKDEKNLFKIDLALYLKKKLKKDKLCQTTLLREQKFNILVWTPKL